MTDERIKLIIGSLLHDVGKIIYRTSDRRTHAESGYHFLKEETNIEDTEILNQVRYHHARELKAARLPEDSLAYITYIADNIAAFAFSSVTVENDCGTHFCIDTSGQLYAFGKNYYGVFGKGRTAGYSDTPVTVAFPN